MSGGAAKLYNIERKTIWVAGHRGMVGSAIARRLGKENCTLLTVSRQDLDLRNQAAVHDWVMKVKPDAIILAAAKVGGIAANYAYSAEFIYDNLAIQSNVIEAARRSAVEKLIFLGSSCIYPKMAPQPLKEEYLLTGPLEPTNEWYAIAKIAGLKMCQAYRKQYGCNFISLMPTNLYGPGDNFDLHKSHVIPALIRKIEQAARENAPSVEIWGTGKPRREFLHVDDLADATCFLLEHYADAAPVNVGTGVDITILELAQQIAAIIGYKGEFTHNTSRPDGTPRKLLDVSRLKALGWTPRYDLKTGLEHTIHWYRNTENQQKRLQG